MTEPPPSVDRLSRLRSPIVPLLGVLLYVGIVRAIQASGDGPVGPLWSLLLIVVPALIWLAHFYLLDRYRPEPTHYVLSVFLLGALVAAPLARFLLGLAVAPRWVFLSPFALDRLIVSFLLVATAQELAKYAAVRFTVYLSAEFDEIADGIVYGSACGVGFATALSFEYVAQGVVPAVAATHVAITTLAHACFAAVWGYTLGLAKMRARGQWVQIAGLLAAVVLNGAFYVLQDMTRRSGSAPWTALAVCAAFAAVIFAGISWLMRRSLAQDAAAPAVPPAFPRVTGVLGVLRRADLGVLLVAAVLLTSGRLAVSARQDRSATLVGPGLVLRHPAGWMRLDDAANELPTPTGAVAALAALTTDTFPPRVVVWRERLQRALSGGARALVELLRPRRSLFHLIRATETTIQGRQGMRLEYAHALRPGARADEPRAGAAPVAVRSSLVCLPAALWIDCAEVSQSAVRHREDPDLAERILRSVRARP